MILKVVIDVEWGAFGDNGVLDFIKTDFDKEVDKNSLLVGSFTQVTDFFSLIIGIFGIGKMVHKFFLRVNLR